MKKTIEVPEGCTRIDIKYSYDGPAKGRLIGTGREPKFFPDCRCEEYEAEIVRLKAENQRLLGALAAVYTVEHIKTIMGADGEKN